MGHAHGHAHGGYGHGRGVRRPSKEVKAMVVTTLEAAVGDKARELTALAPLQMQSPMLYQACAQLVEGGNGRQALALVMSSPTRISGGLLAFLIVGPIVFAGLLTAVILALTLHR